MWIALGIIAVIVIVLFLMMTFILIYAIISIRKMFKDIEIDCSEEDII